MKLHKKIIYMGTTLLWIGIIFSFSLQPAEMSESLSSGLGKILLENLFPEVLECSGDSANDILEFFHFFLRKVAHFTEYFVLGILMTITLRKFAWKKRRYCNLAVILLCILVASMDETIQLFVSGRSGQISDVLLDCTGALLGMGLIKSIYLHFRKECGKIL